MDFHKKSCLPSRLLSIELQQSADEGKDVSAFKEDATTISALGDDAHVEREQRATELFLKIQRSAADQFAYSEPSDWEQIKNVLPSSEVANHHRNVLPNNLLGGILGKCIGCLIGKPIEGWQQNKIISFLKETNNYPIHRYLFDNINPQIYEKYKLSRDWNYPITGMPEDDDVNYLLLAFKTIQQHGLAFQSEHVAQIWIDNIPLTHLCTAERIAYRNFTNGVYPPESAYFCNPYREWIGAQIRADVYGYMCPGNPLLAMELAWKDARISHIKNGIYGSIWIAVMLSLCPDFYCWQKIIQQSLQFIPAESRFQKSIVYILQSFEDNTPVEEVLSHIHRQYSENNIHHWCHVLPNAMIVATALLWSQGNLLSALHIVMTAGFDTDSNGASVGSLMGYAMGANAISDYWKDALQNKIFSPVVGMNVIDIKQFANDLAYLSFRLNLD